VSDVDRLRAEIEEQVRSLHTFPPETDDELKERYARTLSYSKDPESFPSFEEFVKQRKALEPEIRAKVEAEILVEIDAILKCVLQMRNGDAAAPFTQREFVLAGMRPSAAQFAESLAQMRSVVDSDVPLDYREKFKQHVEALEAHHAALDALPDNPTIEQLDEVFRRHMDRMRNIE
jgi:hypothetical protein